MWRRMSSSSLLLMFTAWSMGRLPQGMWQHRIKLGSNFNPWKRYNRFISTQSSSAAAIPKIWNAADCIICILKSINQNCCVTFLKQSDIRTQSPCKQSAVRRWEGSQGLNFSIKLSFSVIDVEVNASSFVFMYTGCTLFHFYFYFSYSFCSAKQWVI